MRNIRNQLDKDPYARFLRDVILSEGHKRFNVIDIKKSHNIFDINDQSNQLIKEIIKIA